MLLLDHHNAPLKDRGLNKDIMSARLYQSFNLYRLIPTLGDFQIVNTGGDIFEAEPSDSVGPTPERRLSIIDPLDSDRGICNGRRAAETIYDTRKTRIRRT